MDGVGGGVAPVNLEEVVHGGVPSSGGRTVDLGLRAAEPGAAEEEGDVVALAVHAGHDTTEM